MTVDDTVERVVDALRREEAVIIPTDTVYGLAADPASEAAMSRLFALKRRTADVPIAVLVGSLDQARELVDVTPSFERLAAAHWPGALTLVAPARDPHRLRVGSTPSLGVRLPDHDLVRRITSRFGPIAATSANEHGAPTVTSAEEAAAVFGDRVGVIIDGGVIAGTASTVVDVSGKRPIVLRAGVITVGEDD